MTELLHPKIIYFVTKECSPNWGNVNQQISHYSLVFVTEGSAEYEVDNVHFHVKEGDSVFIKPGSIRTTSTSGMFCVAIDFVLPKQEDINLPTVFSWGHFEDFHIIFQDLKFEWLQKKEGYKLKSQALLLIILHKLLYEKKQANSNVHVEIMKHFIMKNYTKNLTVSMVASEVKLNSTYCGALFKKVEGRTIAEFINLVRINNAITLLETGEYNIGEVAEETGFVDIYYFSNTFKKIVGMSPSAYKNKQLCDTRLLMEVESPTLQ